MSGKIPKISKLGNISEQTERKRKLNENSSSSENEREFRKKLAASTDHVKNTGRTEREKAAISAAAKILGNNSDTEDTSTASSTPSDTSDRSPVMKQEAKSPSSQGGLDQQQKPWEEFREELGPTLLEKDDFTDEQKKVIKEHGGLSTRDGVWKHVSDNVWQDGRLTQKQKEDKLARLYKKFDEMLNKGEGS